MLTTLENDSWAEIPEIQPLPNAEINRESLFGGTTQGDEEDSIPLMEIELSNA
jgi:hypothetical protein